MDMANDETPESSEDESRVRSSLVSLFSTDRLETGELVFTDVEARDEGVIFEMDIRPPLPVSALFASGWREFCTECIMT
jgi:hypothetical protein